MFCVIRIRGSVNLPQPTRDALGQLRLNRINSCVLLKGGKDSQARIKRVKDYVTWGEIGGEALAKLLGKRGRLAGNRRLGKEFLEKHKMKSVDDLAKELVKGGKKLEDFGVKPVFRLSPPRKGHARAGIKKTYNIGGALGYRASDIGALLAKMM